MPNYQESIAYARERLDRLEDRFRYRSYSHDWYLQRAANSATRRMTNLNKLESWAYVLEDAGYQNAAQFARDRIDGLRNGTIVAPVRRRLPRTQVPRYERVNPVTPNPTGPSYVEYVFDTGGEDI